MTTSISANPSLISKASELGGFVTPQARRILYVVFLLALVFFAAVRVRLRNAPLERDEGEYAYSGQLMLQGIPPYKLAYNMKLPGTYTAYAVIMGVLGQTPAAIRIGLLAVNVATSLLIFVIAKRLHGALTGVVAGCTYALLSTRSSVLGFSAHATNFVIFFALTGILLLLYAIERRRNSLILLSGMLLGVGFLMKQHGILLAAFAGLYLLWMLRANPLRDLFVRAIVFAAGVALPYLLTCFILYRAGVFHQFWFWTVWYGRAYASEMTWRDGLDMIRGVGPWMVRPFVIWEIAVVGFSALIWNKKVREQAAFSVSFLIFSILAVIPGYYFRPHYFIVLLPAVSLWTGIAVAATQEWLSAKPSWRRFHWIPLAVFAIAFAFSVHGQRRYFFSWDPVTVSRAMYQGHGYAEAMTVADYIKANSSDQDRLAIIGSEPEICFYSHRHSATGYIYTFSLVEAQPYAREMQQQFKEEIESAHPKFVVFADLEPSWQVPGYKDRMGFLQDILQWVSSEYHLQEMVPVPGNAVALNAPAQAGFYIFQRN